MPSKRTAESALRPRKLPRQKRAEETVATIVEAAARILEKKGFAGFNTNAIAEKAGISIGSLYQYFPSKDALLRAIIEREMAPLVDVKKALDKITDCRSALRCYIEASIRHQMRRPALARLIDVAEKWDIFDEQVVGQLSQLQVAVEHILRRPDAPRIPNLAIAAADVLAITRSLIDAAGERGESDSPRLLRRVEGAIWGYLGG